MGGPLSGIRVVEIAGIGPAPFAGMMLADLGADIVRVDRPPHRPGPGGSGPDAPLAPPPPSADILNRGRRSIAVDLKAGEGVATVLQLVAQADALIEGFRPGVMERLGLGPDVALAHNPSLVYGRMTGWGQDGPYAHTAGHDINYIALAGVLAHIGRAGEAPVPPLNLVGDFGGGGMLLAFGVTAALLEVARGGSGQVVDAAMVDGAALLMAMFWGLRSTGDFDEDHRGTNVLDTGAYFYDVYRCADGAYVSIAAAEPRFYAEFLGLLGLEDDPEFARQGDRELWPKLRRRLEENFATKTRAEWGDVFEGTDVCFAPVLTMSEAADHPHNVARGTFVELAGVVQPAPAPRFTASPASLDRPAPHVGEHTREVLSTFGFTTGEIDALVTAGVVQELDGLGAP